MVDIRVIDDPAAATVALDRVRSRLLSELREPASAAGVAGVRQLAASGRLERSATVVCILTGHGLKDPDTAPGEVGTAEPVEPTAQAIREALGG